MRISIFTKITVLTLFISLGSVGLLFFVNYITILEIEKETITASTKTVELEVVKNLDDVVRHRADFVENFFKDIENIISAEVLTVRNVHENPDKYKYEQPALSNQFIRGKEETSPENVVSDLEFSPKYNQMVSFGHMIVHAPVGVDILYNSSGVLYSDDIKTNTGIGVYGKLLNYFKGVVEEHGEEIVWIYFCSKDSGFYLYPGNGPIPEGVDPKQRGWYKLAVEKRGVVWTEPYIDVGGQGLMITVSSPVYSEGEFIGVVAADVTIETINEEIENFEVGDTGYSYIIDDSGKIISKPDYTVDDVGWDESFELESMRETGNKDLDVVTEEMIDGQTGNAIVSFVDGDKYVSYAPIGVTGWSLAVVLPVDETLKGIVLLEQTINNEIKNNLNKSITISLFVSVMAILGSILFSKTITRPILRLKKVMNEIVAKDDLSLRPEITSKDEIGDLAQTFGYMIDKLKKTRKKFEDYSKGLEEKIKNRTQELEKKNKELESFNEKIVNREIKMVELKKKLKESNIDYN